MQGQTAQKSEHHIQITVTADEHSTYLPTVAPEPPPKKLFPVTGAQYCSGLRCLNLHTQDKGFIPHYILLLSSLNRTLGCSSCCLVDQKNKTPDVLLHLHLCSLSKDKYIHYWLKTPQKLGTKEAWREPQENINPQGTAIPCCRKEAWREAEVGSCKAEPREIPNQTHWEGPTPAPEGFNSSQDTLSCSLGAPHNFWLITDVQMSSGCLNQGRRTSCQNICSRTAHQHWESIWQQLCKGLWMLFVGAHQEAEEKPNSLYEVTQNLS